MTAFVANTNLLEITGLKSAAEDSFINGATVTVTLKVGTADGDDLVGPTWPLTFDYVIASDGNYRVALSHDLVLLHNHTYVAIIDADGGETPFERFGHWEFKFKPRTRTGDPDKDEPTEAEC